MEVICTAKAGEVDSKRVSVSALEAAGGSPHSPWSQAKLPAKFVQVLTVGDYERVWEVAAWKPAVVHGRADAPRH